MIPVWNSLPDLMVSADTVDRLDRFWLDQEINATDHSPWPNEDPKRTLHTPV